MAGSMSLADLRADLQASLHDAAAVFADPEDFDRLLAAAGEDMGGSASESGSATLTLADSLDLVAGQSEYPAPADFQRFKMGLWGTATVTKPWDKNYPGRLPDVFHCGDVLVLSPAPTAAQIAILGSEYRYFYFASYVTTGPVDVTDIPPANRSLLLLRAQAEACREMALRNLAKPVTMRDGISGQTRNGTPASLYQSLLKEFYERIGR